MSARVWLWVGLAVLGVANLVVGAAWLGRDGLVAAGWLAEPGAARIDLPPQALPPAAEADSEVGHGETPEAPRESSPQTQAAQRGTCVALGPFATRDKAMAVGDGIVAAGGETLLVEGSEVGEADYFVYVEPAASRALAHRTWRELVAQGVDAFVIPRGERENAVSVGVFSRAELAEAQHARVSELGFRVATRTVRRSHATYLLHAWDAPAEALADLAKKPCRPSTQQPPDGSQAISGANRRGGGGDVAADRPGP